MITIYTTQDCPYCSMTRKYLQGRGVEFIEVDVGSSPHGREVLFEKIGQHSVPLIEIRDTIIVGFDRDAIEEEIKQIENLMHYNQ